MSYNTLTLAGFLSALSYDDLPEVAIERCEALFLDWLGCALASRGMHPLPLFERYARRMGPSAGRSQILANGERSSAYFAALVNGASSHMLEQDDVHNGAVLHAGAVVFPAAVAAAQELGRSGRELILAAVAGYEAGIRIGEFLGRSHYRIYNTTATVGTLAAAVAVGKLLSFNQQQFIHLLGSAGTQASGLWQFLHDAADTKQLHIAKAAADGLLAAYMTAEGLSAAQNILEGEQGMGVAMSDDADPRCLVDGLGSRWALCETSFKFHASCRHTHPAADALSSLMQREGLSHEQIVAVSARVHQGAIDLLKWEAPQTPYQAKFSMGAVLGLIAVHGRAGVVEFADHLYRDPRVVAFSRKVSMKLDAEVDAAYPKRWLGRVEVVTVDGRRLLCAIDEAKGDPGNSLSRQEQEDKFRSLVAFAGALNADQADGLIERARSLREAPDIYRLI
ncbi:MmgE/PrpD family protein [Pseudomonas benzenivorans]|uniref:MmgE/PrpD family protein n=1 Tax=Pseudomonas benzenivorans TaxID=556533 RepID=A0ABZ0Q0L3_9PSED|nr:MmgE/PrpD family protein [Pseudomonas benzenivorans]WPC06234.1 MmgE/PrpD family protein [Pseudomonas benzenivorans]